MTTQTFGSSLTQKDVLLFEVDALMEVITVNLGQRDLSTILAVWTDNLMEGQYVGKKKYINSK